MNVPTVTQEDLNRWRRGLAEMRGNVSRARGALSRADAAGALATLTETEDAAARLGVFMEQAGAERPPEMRPRPTVPPEYRASEKNRAYADALRLAWDAGLAVDRERYGSDIGTDGCAQVVEMVLADVEMEIYGPAGRGEGINR